MLCLLRLEPFLCRGTGSGVSVALWPAHPRLGILRTHHTTSGSLAVGVGILIVGPLGCAGGVGVCRLLSPRADRSARHRIVAAVAVYRSTRTGSAAHSRPARSAQTRSRSPRDCADAVRPGRGA